MTRFKMLFKAVRDDLGLLVDGEAKTDALKYLDEAEACTDRAMQADLEAPAILPDPARPPIGDTEPAPPPAPPVEGSEVEPAGGETPDSGTA